MKPLPSVRDLYPSLSDDQAKEAEENLERYLELLLRIYERLQSDPDAYARFRTLTHPEKYHTIDPPKVAANNQSSS